MSGDAKDFIDLMGREGPCFHCGTHHDHEGQEIYHSNLLREDTPLWRSGPPEKPVLCNACGSRWRTRGTLEDYIPKHAMKDAQSSQPQLFPKLNPTSSAPILGAEEPKFVGSNVVGHNQSPFVFGSNVVGHDQSPFVFGAGSICGSGSGIALSENITQTQNLDETIQAPLWDPNNVSRKKRSTLEQRVLSPTERLHQQLHIAMEEQSDNDEDDAESWLIFEPINKYIPENEIGLGCMLLKPPTSPAKDSKPEPAVSSSEESKPESSVGVKVAAAAAKDSKLPIENTTGLIDVPIGESSE